MAFLGLDPGDPINWYQSPRSNMCGVWFAPDDPYLPPPWKGVIDGNTRCLYYWNLETNITQYEKPAYWVQSSCSPPSFYHSPVTASSDYTCPSQYPNLHPQYQRPAETVINGFKFPQQFPFPNPTNTSTSQPIYPQSNSLVEPIYPNFRSFQPEHDLNPSIPIFQSPPVPTFLPQTQFLNPFPSFGVGSSNAPTTTTAASPPSLDSTPSQSLTSGSNSSPFGPTVSAAISGTTSSSSSQPPISDVPEQNEVPHSKLAVSTLMDELQKPRQSLSVAIAEEVNLAVQVDHSSSGRNSDAKLKSDNVIPSNGVDLTVLDANLTAVQLLQDLTNEDTVDGNDEPPPILVNGFVDDNQPGGTTYLQCPPQVSLSSVEIPVSSINALECHPLSVVRIDECLPWLDFVLIVEKNFVLMVEKNENFSSRSPAMNSVNRLETIEDAGELFLIMPERNIVSWKTLISALVLNGQEEKALGVYDTMISEGMVPTHFSLATLFGACEGWLDVEKEIELNVILYNTLLLLGADIGYTDQAIKIFEDVKSSETWKPDSWTFSSMMTIYSCSGKVSEARRTLNEMMEAGFQLNILILISLIQFYGKAKRTDDVVEAFNQLQQLGITPYEHFCGYLLNVMTQTPKGELPELNDCIKRGNEKLGYVVRPLVGKQDSSQNFRKEASELFNSVGFDMKAYYNCFISLRVNLQLLKRACEFLNLGLTLEIYTDIQSKYPTQWSLYLKGLSVGAVFTALHVWINDLSRSLESGEELLILFGINTENGQTKAISQTRSFSIEVIDFLKVNSVFSSSRYTYGPVISMITVVSQSVVHLIFHAWLLLIHAHKHNIGKRTSLVTLPYFALGTVSHVLEYLNVIFVNVLTHKKGAVDVICHATIFYVEFVFLLHMQMVEKLMPSPIVEFPGHSMTRKEIVTFWIWLPTALLHLQTKVILLENTYTGAYFQVTFVLGNVNDDFHMVYSTICCLLLFNFEIPHVVVSRYWRLDYISECNLLIIDNEPTQSVLTMICKGAAKQSKADKLMFFHFDLVGSIPTEPLDHSDSKPLNCRYDAQISVFRSKPQHKLGDAKVFMIGSGTLECELLKHVTLMGASCGNQGKRAIIDDDVIEKSNPSKHIIFRDWDIGWAKSTVAASTAASINLRPRLDIVAFYNRVRPETENVFDDTIWGSPSVDLNAVHNVNGKLYVGQRSSKFLLNWLVQPEHEHRKWFAAISVRLISSGLHITNHKQMLEKCLRVVKSTLDVLHIMQKSGIKQNYQSFLQSYLPYVSVGKAFPSLQHEHHIDPTDVKTVISYVHQQEVPSSYSSVISQEGQHQMERVVTRLNFPTDWKNWQICLLLVGMFLVFAVAFYIFFEKSDNPWNLPLEKYQPARPEFWEIQKLCLLHSFCYYHINAPRHELGADVISSDFSLLNVDDLADQFVALVDFLGLKKVLSLGGDLHDGVGTIWKIIQA